MTAHGYKKYMKKDVKKEHPLFKIFIISFFGMLLISTFIINSLVRNMSVDTSIGDYKEQSIDDTDGKNIVDTSLAAIQNEDRSRSFTDLMQNPSDVPAVSESKEYSVNESTSADNNTINTQPKPVQDTVYKVFIGSYTTSEQAKVAKEIIQESGSGFNPIVKCIGANNYTLQVGIFKNKTSAESLLDVIRRNNLPGRIVQEN